MSASGRALCRSRPPAEQNALPKQAAEPADARLAVGRARAARAGPRHPAVDEGGDRRGGDARARSRATSAGATGPKPRGRRSARRDKARRRTPPSSSPGGQPVAWRSPPPAAGAAAQVGVGIAQEGGNQLDAAAVAACEQGHGAARRRTAARDRVRKRARWAGPRPRRRRVFRKTRALVRRRRGGGCGAAVSGAKRKASGRVTQRLDPQAAAFRIGFDGRALPVAGRRGARSRGRCEATPSRRSAAGDTGRGGGVVGGGRWPAASPRAGCANHGRSRAARTRRLGSRSSRLTRAGAGSRGGARRRTRSPASARRPCLRGER